MAQSPSQTLCYRYALEGVSAFDAFFRPFDPDDFAWEDVAETATSIITSCPYATLDFFRSLYMAIPHPEALHGGLSLVKGLKRKSENLALRLAQEVEDATRSQKQTIGKGRK